jgi:hypothetical protein
LKENNVMIRKLREVKGRERKIKNGKNGEREKKRRE